MGMNRAVSASSCIQVQWPTRRCVCACVCVTQTKEEMVGTVEAVQALQVQSGHLQKSKEGYHGKCVELDRLRKEGAPLKELEKVSRTNIAIEVFENWTMWTGSQFVGKTFGCNSNICDCKKKKSYAYQRLYLQIFYFFYSLLIYLLNYYNSQSFCTVQFCCKCLFCGIRKAFYSILFYATLYSLLFLFFFNDVT